MKLVMRAGSTNGNLDRFSFRLGGLLPEARPDNNPHDTCIERASHGKCPYIQTDRYDLNTYLSRSVTNDSNPYNK